LTVTFFSNFQLPLFVQSKKLQFKIFAKTMNEEVIVSPTKRQRQEKLFIELTDEELMAEYREDSKFAQLLIEGQKVLKDMDEGKIDLLPASPIQPAWKEELQKKIQEMDSLEDLDGITREIVKKNKPRKLPKKKLVRVENFYQRHIGGLAWMQNFLSRTKTEAISRPYVERMLELEKKFQKFIEEDNLLGPQLKDE
jgi:hypothetical protein